MNTFEQIAITYCFAFLQQQVRPLPAAAAAQLLIKLFFCFGWRVVQKTRDGENNRSWRNRQNNNDSKHDGAKQQPRACNGTL